MADTARPVEINGLVFASTNEGHLLESEVRGHIEALQREIAELRARAEHVTSLERLAQATVMKADDLALEIEAEARRRVDQLTDACETELVERRRQFEAESSAQQAAAQARVAQLQAALEGTLQTLGRALQAAGAPALEMPAASAQPWTAPAGAAATSQQATDADWRHEPAGARPDAVSPSEDGPHTYFGMGTGLPAADADVADGGLESEHDEPSFAADSADSPAVSQAEAAADIGSFAEEREATAASAEAGWAEAAGEGVAEMAAPTGLEPDGAGSEDGAPSEGAAERGGSGTYELTRPTRPSPEPTPIRPTVVDRAENEAAPVPADPGPNTLSRTGPATLEIDMRPVKSFADLARVTKLLGRIAPGAQPVDLNLPQHRALFSVRGKDSQALAAQLQEALPEAKVVERAEGLDVLLEGEE
jgi:hypothetical protein